MRIRMKKVLIYTLFCGLMLLGLFADYGDYLQNRIAENIVRLHIVANSDATFDQELKLDVRDRVLDYLEGKTANAASAQESEELITTELDNIIGIAQKEIRAQGYGYTVTATVGRYYFPTKLYEEGFSLPAGRYDALRIAIGDATGKNWWCVLYPNVCGNSEYKSALEGVLNRADYETVTSPNYKFRIAEWFGR